MKRIAKHAMQATTIIRKTHRQSNARNTYPNWASNGECVKDASDSADVQFLFFIVSVVTCAPIPMNVR
jgi:hypothetical protein